MSSTSAAAATQAPGRDPLDVEQRFVIHGVDWYPLNHSTTWSSWPSERIHRERGRPVAVGPFHRGGCGRFGVKSTTRRADTRNTP